MYRHCHQRYPCVPPLPKAERKLTGLVSPFVLAEQADSRVAIRMSPFVLAEPKLSRHWQLRNALVAAFQSEKKKA